MPVFTFKFAVDAPLESVRDFHASPEALRRLTPPPLILRLHRHGEMKEGMAAEFTIWLGPIPMRWKAVHRDVSPRGFTDVQAEGPAAAWEHTHRFTPLAADRTEIREHIKYAHKPGPAGWLTRLLFAKAGLWMLFQYRKLATRRALKGFGPRVSRRP